MSKAFHNAAEVFVKDDFFGSIPIGQISDHRLSRLCEGVRKAIDEKVAFLASHEFPEGQSRYEERLQQDVLKLKCRLQDLEAERTRRGS